MHSERWYQIALTLIPHTGPVLRKRLIAAFGSASAVFSASRKELKGVEGISENAARQILDWNNFNAVDSEMRFIEKQQIQPCKKKEKVKMGCLNVMLSCFQSGLQARSHL